MITKSYAISIIFTMIAMIGSFYAGNYLASSSIRNQNLASYSDTFEQAKKEIPPPELPPKPAGQTVTTIVQQKVTVPTPRIETEFQKGPFGLKIAVPKVITEQKEIMQEVPSTKLVDASPEQISNWNAQVKKIQDEYNNAVAERARLIEVKNAEKKRAELIESAKNITKDIIIPLVTALTGLIGAIAALRWGKKTPPAA